MARYVPLIVFGLTVPAVMLVGTWLQTISQRRFTTVPSLLRFVIGYGGLVALASLYVPLAPRVGGVWAMDIVVGVAVLWQLVISIAVFGERVPRRAK